MESDKILAGFYGQAIGDALGVPVEFKSREYLEQNPVRDFLGYMCWNQPPGTFSDDSSMMFCTAESLVHGFNIDDIALNFVKWYREGYWGAHDELFDIGGTTRRSLQRIHEGEDPRFSGEYFPENNGNGSLMRILPLIYYLQSTDKIEARYQVVKQLSSITHAHFRSVLACFIFVELGIELLRGASIDEGYWEMQRKVNGFLSNGNYNLNEIGLFKRTLVDDIRICSKNKLSSLGYVLDSLESSLWCLMTSESYEESVLKSVNLGGDTDTTAAICGGIAGIYFGIENIPVKWISEIAKRKEIENLALKFATSIED